MGSRDKTISWSSWAIKPGSHNCKEALSQSGCKGKVLHLQVVLGHLQVVLSCTLWHLSSCTYMHVHTYQVRIHIHSYTEVNYFRQDKVNAQLMQNKMCSTLSLKRVLLPPHPSPVALQIFIWASSINNDSGILTTRFKHCSTAPCARRRLTWSFYFYMFSDISECHSTTTGKETLSWYLAHLCTSPLPTTQTHPWQVQPVSTCSPPVNIWISGKKKRRESKEHDSSFPVG